MFDFIILVVYWMMIVSLIWFHIYKKQHDNENMIHKKNKKTGAELEKEQTPLCPWCNRRFFKSLGYKRKYKGETLVFCSWRCFDNWILNNG